jgi:hypothetical protein
MGMGKGGAYKSTHQGMGRARGNAKPPGKQVPDDGGDNACQNHMEGNELGVYPLGNRITDTEFLKNIFGHEEGGKVENCCPNNCLKGRKHFGGNNGGNGIGRIVEPIDVVEYKCQNNDNNQESKHTEQFSATHLPLKADQFIRRI